MKKIIIVALMAVGIGLIAKAAGPLVYWGPLVNQPGLTYNALYPLDTDQQTQINFVSASMVYSSSSISAVSFTDGTPSTASVTVASNSQMTAVASTDSITLGSTASLAAIASTNSITIVSTTSLSGSVFYFNGIPFVAGKDFAADTTTGAATGICNLFASYAIIQATTTSAGNVITATATLTGLIGNTYTFATTATGGAMTFASANFTGGQQQLLTNSYLTINGINYLNGQLWQTGRTSTDTAVSLVTMLSSISGITASTAPSNGLLITATATVAGSAGNLLTMTSSIPSAMKVSGPSFAGGSDAGTITFDGVTIATSGATGAASATAIASLINSNATLEPVVKAQAIGAVVYATATTVGTAYNFPILTNNTTALTVVGFTGGVNSAINLATDQITSVSPNGLTLALPVLLTKSAGTAPAPLAANATYYAIPVNTSSFELAFTSTGAVAGTSINITTTTQTGGGSFSVSPLGITGTAGLSWQISNDATNWSNLAVSSVTFGSPYTAGTSYWDFSQVNYRYLRANVVAPTTGGFNVVVTINAKN